MAFVYFRHDDASSQSLHSAISIIIRQLIARKPGLLSKYKEKISNKFSRVADRTVLLTTILNDLKATYIILDALDEFSGDHNKRIELVKHLTSLITKVDSGKLRLCVTSRPFTDIWHLTRSTPETTLEIRAPVEDIDRMIDDTIARNSHFQEILATDRLMQSQGDLRRLMGTKVVEKSDCMCVDRSEYSTCRN